ncbi:MAG TPA: universal stress protein [Terracidiphilus sp.]|jgi:nucleotide-binding universal stress UspA family protein|nr:universal stress protein [Terracidiphilus sp.]
MSTFAGSVDLPALRLSRILFASNFTETSAAALPYAAAFARRFNAQIHVIHVIAPDEYAHIEPAQLEATLRQMKADTAERIRKLLAASQFSDIPCRIFIEHGDVTETIAALAREQGIDLIVAGSQGRHGVQKLLSPSTDEAIAREVGCPVLLIGPAVTARPEDEMNMRRILLATDFEPHSGTVMNYAYALAAAYAARLSILHVADDVWKEPLSTRMTPDAFCRMRLLENHLPEHTQGMEPKFLVEFGEPESLILETAQRIGADLIVAGVPAATHPGLSARLPGPLAYNLASHAACPVLAVRNAAADQP